MEARNPSTHQPTKADMEEVIKLDATPNELADALLRGGAERKQPPEAEAGLPA